MQSKHDWWIFTETKSTVHTDENEVTELNHFLHVLSWRTMCFLLTQINVICMMQIMMWVLHAYICFSALMNISILAIDKYLLDIHSLMNSVSSLHSRNAVWSWIV